MVYVSCWVGCGGSTHDVAATTSTTDTAAVSEMPSLDGYTGQSLPELLAMTDTYRLDSVILAIEQGIQHKAPADLSAPERVVLAVEALEREVNNGGYGQFFLNEPEHAHEIVRALNQIGAHETTRITEQAARALGVRQDWTRDAIVSAATDLDDEDTDALAALDDEFYAYPDPIEEQLLAFIRANAAKIQL